MKGLWRQIFNAVSLLASYWIALTLYSGFAAQYPIVNIDAIVGIQLSFNSIAWFIIVFLVARIICHMASNLMIKGRKSPAGKINSFAGLLVGFLEACIVISLCIRFVQLPFIENGTYYLQNSVLTTIQQQIDGKKGEIINQL